MNDEDQPAKKTTLSPFIIAVYCILITLINCFTLVPNTIVTALLGSHIGKDAINGFTLALQPSNFVFGTYLFFAYQMISHIAREYATGNYKMVGTRFNASLMITLAFTVVAGGVMFGISRSLFAIYTSSHRVSEEASTFFDIYILFSPVTLSMSCFVGFFEALHRVERAFVVMLFRTIVVIILNYIAIAVLKQGLAACALCYGVSDVVSFLFALVLAYRPNDIKQLHLFSCSWWRDIRAVFSMFAVDSVVMLVRGMAMMIGYTSCYAIAARMGTTEQAAHVVLAQLITLMSYSSDAIGVVCNMYGSYLIGQKKYDTYLKFCKIMPLIGLSLCIVPILILAFAGGPILSLYTSDHDVIRTAHSLFPVFLPIFVAASTGGLYEGLMYSDKRFKWVAGPALLVVIFGVVPILALAAHFKSLLLVWLALALFLGTRAPVGVFVVHVLIRNKILKEMEGFTPLVEDTEQSIQ